MLRILRDLSINRKGYVEGEFLKQKDKEVHSFEKGYWKGHKISQMSTYYIEKARDYAYKIATLPEVDKRSEPEKLYDNLKEIYHRHFNWTLWGMCKSDYVWLLGRKIIKLLDKHKDIDFDSTLFGIEVKEDISDHTTILLCKKVGGDNE